MALAILLIGVGYVIGAASVLLFLWIGDKSDQWKKESEES